MIEEHAAGATIRKVALVLKPHITQKYRRGLRFIREISSTSTTSTSQKKKKKKSLGRFRSKTDPIKKKEMSRRHICRNYRQKLRVFQKERWTDPDRETAKDQPTPESMHPELIS